MKLFIVLLLALVLPESVQSQQFIFVFLNKKADKAELPEKEIKKIDEGHMANIRRLAKEGKLIVAGPFDGGGGIFIFKAASSDQAKEWLASDPGVQANRWNVEVLPYTPRVGSVCLAKEPIHMVNYEFVRYTINITKYNVRDAAETSRKHDDYLKKIAQTGNIVAEGTFGEDGGILVIKGELQGEVIEADPSVSEGLFQVDYKKLFVAEGAFCEK
jgi:uncharacterized protein YciI